MGVAGAMAAGWSVLRFLFASGPKAHSMPGGAFSSTVGSAETSGPSLAKNPDGSWSLDADALPMGQSLVLSMSGVPVLILHGNKGVRAFSATCTHLGCLVRFSMEDNQFQCPCHGGKYDENGRVVAGPPPMDLKEYRVDADDGDIRIFPV